MAPRGRYMGGCEGGKIAGWTGIGARGRRPLRAGGRAAPAGGVPQPRRGDDHRGAGAGAGAVRNMDRKSNR